MNFDGNRQEENRSLRGYKADMESKGEDQLVG